MNPRLLLLLLVACAGPTAHLTAQRGSALEPTSAQAARPSVASTLAPAEPLDARACGLPTAGPTCPAPEAEPETPAEDPHRHHHGAPPSPAPEPAQPAEDPHRHHHGAAPPMGVKPAEPVAAKVIDPNCKMQIDPKTAKGGSLRLNGEEHWFCSSSCRNTWQSQNSGAK